MSRITSLKSYRFRGRKKGFLQRRFANERPSVFRLADAHRKRKRIALHLQPKAFVQTSEKRKWRMDIPEMGDSRVCQAKRGRKRQCLFNGTFIFNLALTGAFACDKHAFDVRELYKVFPTIVGMFLKRWAATQLAVELKPILTNRL